MDIAVIMGPEPQVLAERVLRTQRAQAAALSVALAGRGHEVTIHVGDDASGACTTDLGPAVRVVSASADLARHLAGAWAARLPDLVYATGTAAGLAALAAVGERPVALVQDARGAALPERPEELYGPAHRILALSTDHCALLVRLGIAHHKVAVLPYGSTTQGLAPEETLRVGRGARTLLCPDGPGPGQGAADVVSTLPWLDADLVITGGPAPADLSTDADVRGILELAARLEVADRVRVRGRLPAAELGAQYGEADVVVTVPHRPSAGLTCLDAMSCGRCVVATALGAPKDAVLHGITGLLVPPADPRALARALRRLLSQPTLITSFGFAAADRARMRYGWEQLAMEAERVFIEARRLVDPDVASHRLSTPGDDQELSA